MCDFFFFLLETLSLLASASTYLLIIKACMYSVIFFHSPTVIGNCTITLFFLRSLPLIPQLSDNNKQVNLHARQLLPIIMH